MNLSALQGNVTLMANSAQHQEFGAQVVTKTLDNLNQSGQVPKASNASYDFQTSVLGAYAGTGININITI